MLLADTVRHSARLRPRHVAVVDDFRTLTYAQLSERVRRVAVALSDGLGIGRGERFGLVSQNRAEIEEVVFGAALADRICVPMSFRLAGPEICEILADAGAHVLIAERELEATVEAVRAAGFDGRVVWIEPAFEATAGSFEALLAAAEPRFEPLDVAPSNVVVQMYTSGTTGRPKGVMLSHRNLMASSWSHLAEDSAVPGDRYLNTGPLCHLSSGARMWLLAHAGATNVIHRGFDAERVVAALDDGTANCTLVVPSMLRAIVAAARERGAALAGKVRLVTYGAEPMPVELLTEALELLGCGFQQGYGLTEASPNLTILPPADHLPDASGAFSPRLASVGRETVGVHVRVVDGDDRDVAPGEIGEVIARGTNVMEGYWGLPEETAATLRGGWLRTGDLARLDEDGYVYLAGRSKDMLVSGGFNVYPREVERQLEGHPAVAEAAVVGAPHERWGEVPVAYVVARADAADADLSGQLADFLDGRLARYKLPKRYELVDELPRNSSGKVLKRELKARAATLSDL